ncbi:hypothetical protein DFH11DRAFT_1181593 [Phellopilus nigrolimitatus]|nr:hypothetical protein DFH11DRAFT_1181593 [Phellopilus nigrolimitatus]
MAEVPSHIHGPSDLAISHSLPSENSSREIDLVFIQDTFENQDKFLSNSVRAIERTCRHILLLPQPSRGNLRVGLVAYHDDPKDDRSPLLQNLQFTSDMEQMIENIHSLQGTQNAANSQGSNVALELALRAAHKLYWRPSADKIVVLSIHKQSRLLGNSGLAVLQLLSNHNIFLVSNHGLFHFNICR